MISVFLINILILIGTIFMLIFPADIIRLEHLLGATLIFIFSIILAILFSIISLVSAKIKKYHTFVGFLILFLIIIYLLYQET